MKNFAEMTNQPFLSEILRNRAYLLKNVKVIVNTHWFRLLRIKGKRVQEV